MRFLTLSLGLVGMLAATTYAVPVEASTTISSGSPTNNPGPSTACGQFYKIEEEGALPLYANGHYENLEVHTHMSGIDNVSCGICMVFRERDAQGDILWLGGPGQSDGGKARGGQSYYCIYGRMSATASAEFVKTVRSLNARSPTIGCGNYMDNREVGPKDLLATENYQNLELNTYMTSINNVSCGICMVFKGRDAQGEVVWSGGPGQGAGAKVKGAQSYFCLYGASDNTKAPPKEINARNPAGPVCARES